MMNERSESLLENVNELTKSDVKQKVLSHPAVQMGREAFDALDLSTRNYLIKQMQALLYRYETLTNDAKIYYVDGEERIPYAMECCTATVAALTHYDATRSNANFLTYFHTLYRNACTDAFKKDLRTRDKSYGQKPYSDKELSILSKAQEMFSKEDLTKLSYEKCKELADELQIASVKEIRQALQKSQPVWLNACVEGNDGDAQGEEQGARIGAEEESFLEIEQKEVATKRLAELSAFSAIQKLVVTVNVLNALDEFPPEALQRIFDKVLSAKTIDFAFVAYLYDIPLEQATVEYMIEHPLEQKVTDRMLADYKGCKPAYISEVRKKVQKAGCSDK